MPPNPEDFKYPHILLPEIYTHTEPYGSKKGFPRKTSIFMRNRQSHHDFLLEQLHTVEEKLAELDEQREAIGISGNEGITVLFRSEPGFELQYESLELRRSGIELLNIREIDKITYAAVFIPEGKIATFIKRLEKYASEKPRHEKLFANIAEIKKATIEGLWTDDISLIPAQSQTIWWEVWLRSGKDRDSILKYFRNNAHLVGLNLDKEEIYFPDRTVLLAQGTREQMSRSADFLNCIAELRKAKESPEFFIEMRRSEQQEWIDDALKRIDGPDQSNISILILDTGINRLHPLLERFLSEDDLHAYDPTWIKADEQGHGTEMAGLALYGDLIHILSSNNSVAIGYVLESGKIIRFGGEEHKPELYGAVTSQVISKAEIQAPDRKRISSLAIATKDFRDRGKPSSWSSAIDKLTSGYGEENEPKRLIVVCIGNTDVPDRIHYPDSNMSDGIHDPAQAWNALCVGAFTQKVAIDTDQNPEYVQIANAGNISPASTTSLNWQRQWPLKPDVVFEGGNWAKSGGSAIGGDLDEIRLLTTNKDFTRNYFTITGDTSAATTQIARFAAIIQAHYPDFWPETVRALIVHSAEWTPSILAQWELNPLPAQTNKAQIQNLIRYCGFGVPDITRALYCSENSLSLIVQSSLYPFEKVDKRLKMRDMNLHNIPWPVDVLEDLGNTPVEMRITLSYFIEPNPGERGWKRRHSYASHGLRFDVNLPTESRDQFRMYINAVAREEEENPNIQSHYDSGEWVLGKDLRHKGSIHSDIWMGTAINLAQRQFVGVYPVVGWWRECPHHERWNKQARYSLIISITTPAEDVQLYTEIENRISIEIAT